MIAPTGVRQVGMTKPPIRQSGLSPWVTNPLPSVPGVRDKKLKPSSKPPSWKQCEMPSTSLAIRIRNDERGEVAL